MKKNVILLFLNKKKAKNENDILMTSNKCFYDVICIVVKVYFKEAFIDFFFYNSENTKKKSSLKENSIN